MESRTLSSPAPFAPVRGGEGLGLRGNRSDAGANARIDHLILRKSPPHRLRYAEGITERKKGTFSRLFGTLFALSYFDLRHRL